MKRYEVWECHEYSDSECVMTDITFDEAKAFCDEMFKSSDEWDTWYEIVSEE